MIELSLASTSDSRGWSIPWGWAFAFLGVAGLAVHIAAGINTRFGSLSYDAIMVGAAAAVVLRAIRMREHRLAWSLIGAGMIFWAAGDVYYNEVLLDRADVPYPSLSDGLYLGMY